MTTRGDDGQSDDAYGTVSGMLARLDAADGPSLLAALVALRGLREEVASWEAPLIAAARDAGVSWADLAPALGLSSRQAAERRYLRLRPSGPADVRGVEERVRDERDRRAGDRAVTAWARGNSGRLRGLAGRVGAIEGLPAADQHRVDVLQAALGDDDASALLHPLAAAGPHLGAAHADLARQVRTVTDHVDDLRRETSERRTRDR